MRRVQPVEDATAAELVLLLQVHPKLGFRVLFSVPACGARRGPCPRGSRQLRSATCNSSAPKWGYFSKRARSAASLESLRWIFLADGGSVPRTSSSVPKSALRFLDAEPGSTICFGLGGVETLDLAFGLAERPPPRCLERAALAVAAPPRPRAMTPDGGGNAVLSTTLLRVNTSWWWWW